MVESTDESGEQQTIEVALTGEPAARQAAFEMLVRTHTPALERSLRSRRCTDDEINDIVQETWLRVFRGLGRYQPQGKPFQAWLFGVVKNVWREMLRKRLDLAGEQDLDVSDGRDEAGESVDRMTREDFVERVRRLIETAPETTRLYLEAFLAEFEPTEVMELYGWGRSKTDVAKFRAFKWLRAAWEREYGPTDQRDWI